MPDEAIKLTKQKKPFYFPKKSEKVIRLFDKNFKAKLIWPTTRQNMNESNPHHRIYHNSSVMKMMMAYKPLSVLALALARGRVVSSRVDGILLPTKTTRPVYYYWLVH